MSNTSALRKSKYTKAAVARARDDALRWLAKHHEGRPRTWLAEVENDIRVGYQRWDYDLIAPPVLGYEALEYEGLALYQGVVGMGCQQRARFSAYPDLYREAAKLDVEGE